MTRELLMKTLAILFGGFLVIVFTFTGNSTVVVSYPKMKWTNRNNVQVMQNDTHRIRDNVERIGLANEKLQSTYRNNTQRNLDEMNFIENEDKTVGLANEKFRTVDFYKRNGEGDCPYPKFFDPNLEKESWFPRFFYHLQRVNMTAVHKRRFKEKCYR